jgi:hypothetical protein
MIAFVLEALRGWWERLVMHLEDEAVLRGRPVATRIAAPIQSASTD